MAISGNNAITLRQTPGKPGQVYYPLQVQDVPTPRSAPDHTLLHPTHFALNHRDIFLRQALYPSPSPDTPLFSDACCTALAPSPLAGTRFLLNPSRGWQSQVSGPESPESWGILGGTSTLPIGAGQDTLSIHDDEMVKCPEHLSSAEAAALGLCGVTAWRALVTKAGAKRGDKVLVTGIGGGAALMVLHLAVKMGVRVWVTSGDEAKMKKAMELGAEGGVSYKEERWEKALLKMVGGELDAIIDGAGGDIGKKAAALLKHGGIVVSYGMTIAPSFVLPMTAVLKNIEVKGTTMGSRQEFRDMVAFVDKEKIKPVVSKVVRGKFEDLPRWEELFEEMKAGRQFGKLVYEIDEAGAEASKL